MAAAKHSRSGPRATSEAPAPPSITESRVSRHLTKVPRDQQELIDSPDAWSETLEQDPRGFLNVPPGVLQNLKEFHICKKRRLNAAQAPSTQAPSTQAPSTQAPSRSVSSPSSSPPPPPQQQQQSYLESTSGVSLPAAKTAGHNLADNESHGFVPTAGQRQGESSDEEGPSDSWAPSPERGKHQQTWKCSAPLEGSSSREKEKTESSPRAPKRAPLDILPSSSISSDAELEIEVPCPLDHALQPVNRIAQINPTPPSAQAQVIPCSYSDVTSPPQRPRPKRRALMKPIKIDSRDREMRPRNTNMFPASASVSPAKRSFDTGSLPSASIESCGTNPARPLGVVPETAQEASRQEARSGSQAQSDTGIQSDACGKDLMGPQSGLPAEPAPPLVAVAMEEIPTEKTRAGLGQVPMGSASLEAQSTGSIMSQPPPKSMCLDPFDLYRSMYPEYQGGLEDFVSGCIYLQGLQETGSLPSFAYDDVIRAFHEDFVPYVGSLDPSSKPMTLLEWYNRNVKTLRSNKQTVTSDNLDSVLQTFQAIVRAKRRWMEGADTCETSHTEVKTEAATPRGSDEDEDDAPPAGSEARADDGSRSAEVESVRPKTEASYTFDGFQATQASYTLGGLQTTQPSHTLDGFQATQASHTLGGFQDRASPSPCTSVGKTEQRAQASADQTASRPVSSISPLTGANTEREEHDGVGEADRSKRDELGSIATGQTLLRKLRTAARPMPPPSRSSSTAEGDGGASAAASPPSSTRFGKRSRETQAERSRNFRAFVRKTIRQQGSVPSSAGSSFVGEGEGERERGKS